MNSISENVEYCPMLICTLNRDKHFKECIESLRNNTKSNYIDLYIALDYPKSNLHWDGYRKIERYLKQDFKEFHKLIVIKRKKNYGLKLNYRTARNLIFKQYDRIIVSEDDNVFSPNFFDYMLNAFHLYNNRPDVFAICGFSYPVDWSEDGSNILYCQTFFSAWGYGVWKDKYNDFIDEYTVDYLDQLAKDKERTTFIKQGSLQNFYYLSSSLGEPTVHKNDISISIYIRDKHYLCIMPKLSTVRNCGWDGSGLHCKEFHNFNWENQKIDLNLNFDIIPPPIDNPLLQNIYILNRFFGISMKKKILAVSALHIYRIIGKTKYAKLKSLLFRRKCS